jgi:hypothetical protein
MISDIRVLQIVPAASAVPTDPAANDDNRPPT